ncbi:hypothetical protein B5M06_03995 [Comamonas kerstersii]|uniref:Uncharacterized protein n=1 Tax=Comamonas kerstersii TaxID=225992 RepID=A0A1V0BC87_9BURK|nr:hypothetical protein B5M06_03995 [Comamonas kerstersii]
MRRTPQTSIAGCPKRSAGTQVAGSPLLCLLSFGETKESKSAVGPRPDFLPHYKHTAQIRKRKAPLPTSPQRGEEQIQSTKK